MVMIPPCLIKLRAELIAIKLITFDEPAVRPMESQRNEIKDICASRIALVCRNSIINYAFVQSMEINAVVNSIQSGLEYNKTSDYNRN